MSAGVLGVISDTHGLLRPEAIAALHGCKLIIHAGDVGKPEVLNGLNRIAPTIAVRGNVDRGEWARMLPPHATLNIDGVKIHVLHDLHALDNDPADSDVRVVISGHSHQPRIEEKGGVLYVNPGAAGPRRFRLPVTLALLEKSADGTIHARPINLIEP